MFDSLKKSLGMKPKVEAKGYYDVVFKEEKLGIMINKYTGTMPHLSGGSSNGERSCPVVTGNDQKLHGDVLLCYYLLCDACCLTKNILCGALFSF
jgi:hypothetical protein